MPDCPPSATATAPPDDDYAASKEWFKSKLRQKRREKRLAKGLPVSDDEEPEVELEEGVSIIFKGPGRGNRVELHHGTVAVKRGVGVNVGEAEALRIAGAAGLPVPRVHAVAEFGNDKHIRMEFIPGQTLEQLWKGMDAREKGDIARQLRDIVVAIRSVPPPAQTIGACDGTGIRDSRAYSTYNGPVCADERAFNDYLISDLNWKTPPAVRDAFAAKLRTTHRIVFSHCDLAPRNIIVRDGKVVALIDWSEAGWYPEYWEYVKFFQRNDPGDDFWCYAAEIFPQLYQDQLVDYIALLTWQMP